MSVKLYNIDKLVQRLCISPSLIFLQKMLSTIYHGVINENKDK